MSVCRREVAGRSPGGRREVAGRSPGGRREVAGRSPLNGVAHDGYTADLGRRFPSRFGIRAPPRKPPGPSFLVPTRSRARACTQNAPDSEGDGTPSGCCAHESQVRAPRAVGGHGPVLIGCPVPRVEALPRESWHHRRGRRRGSRWQRASESVKDKAIREFIVSNPEPIPVAEDERLGKRARKVGVKANFVEEPAAVEALRRLAQVRPRPSLGARTHDLGPTGSLA
jgi:hypothetical protein